MATKKTKPKIEENAKSEQPELLAEQPVTQPAPSPADKPAKKSKQPANQEKEVLTADTIKQPAQTDIQAEEKADKTGTSDITQKAEKPVKNAKKAAKEKKSTTQSSEQIAENKAESKTEQSSDIKAEQISAQAEQPAPKPESKKFSIKKIVNKAVNKNDNKSEIKNENKNENKSDNGGNVENITAPPPEIMAVKTEILETMPETAGDTAKKRTSIDKDLLPKRKKKNKPKAVNFKLETAERYFPAVEEGLSDEQVADRVEKGYINYITKKKGKTYRAIFISNIFTFFNILTFIVGAALIASGNHDFGNLFFLVIITANISIGIFQEIRSKRMIDKLSIMSAPTATVVRAGKRSSIPIGEIVLDDIIFTETGRQISADAIVVSGSCEVNESMLTGESEPVKKNSGDMLYSGSFVSSGTCFARVEKIGDVNYIETLTSHAKNYRKPKSELQSSIRLIMKIVTCFIIPISAIMIYQTFRAKGFSSGDLQIGIAGWAGAIIGMIPSGMFLLTSMALAVGVIRLSKRRTLVQDLYCIEMLARADVLCLDKTGTLTDGSMQVHKTVLLQRDDNIEDRIEQVIGSMLSATGDNNQTALALAAKFGFSSAYKPKNVLQFSSQRKYSAVEFEDEGTYILGAPEYILKDMGIRLDRLVAEYASQGYRVICLAQVGGEIGKDGKMPTGRRPLALIVIEDHIREDAKETIQWFKDNDVAVKVISGDNPVTVSEVAKRVGIEKADLYISLDGLSSQEVIEAANKYTVFGRVSPEQKSLLVRSIKAKGHTVAMTGDGVNDILAMREADCSIAIASGAEAARNVSHLVLLDSNFTSMPNVVKEGRRVVNNITKSSALFLTKTFMSIVLSIFFLFTENSSYPITPKNLMLIEMFVIGIPSFCLALQANSNRIKGNFLSNVISRAIPGGTALVISVIGVYIYKTTLPTLGWTPQVLVSNEIYKSMTVLAISFTGIIVLAKICEPFNVFRVFVFLGSIGLMFTAIIIMGSVFEVQGIMAALQAEHFMHILFVMCMVLMSYFVITLMMKILRSLNVMYD